MSNPLAVVRALLAHDSNGATSLVRVGALNCMRKEVEIVNRLGLHARPASELVRCVIRFKSKITICKGDEISRPPAYWKCLVPSGLRRPCRPRGDRADEQGALHQLEAMLQRFRDQEGGAQGN